MNMKINKHDNKKFVRIAKGNKVQNDVALSAAKRLVHKGWSIESDQYDQNGFPRQQHIEQDIPVANIQPFAESKADQTDEQDVEVFEASEPEIDQDELDEIKTIIMRARSKSKLEALKVMHGHIFEVNELINERLTKYK